MGADQPEMPAGVRRPIVDIQALGQPEVAAGFHQFADHAFHGFMMMERGSDHVPRRVVDHGVQIGLLLFLAGPQMGSVQEIRDPELPETDVGEAPKGLRLRQMGIAPEITGGGEAVERAPAGAEAFPQAGPDQLFQYQGQGPARMLLAEFKHGLG